MSTFKCDKCIHKEVCKYRPPKEYPELYEERNRGDV